MLRPAIALCLLLVPALASADVVPDGYVETCTLDAMSRDHAGCVACRTSFQAPDACSQAHASDGLGLACRTGGGSVWTEIWCMQELVAPPPTSATPPPATAAPPATTAPESRSGCAIGSPRSSGGSMLALVAAVLWTLRRRR